jgi:hypothetical protein
MEIVKQNAMEREHQTVTRMKATPNWLLWRYEPSDSGDGKLTKKPYDANKVYHGGGKAKSNDPKTWTTYEKTVRALESFKDTFDGLGFVGDDKFGFGDVDHSVDEYRNIDAAGQELINKLDSYTEISPSGTGIRVIFELQKGAQRGGQNKSGGDRVELYANTQYMTFTGDEVGRYGSGDRTEEYTKEWERLESLKPPKKVKAPRDTTGGDEGRGTTALSDDRLIEIASNAQNKEKFNALWEGDTSAYKDDHSSADRALCGMLAFWTREDEEQMDRLVRRSGLMRDKWDRRARAGELYGEGTIRIAIEENEEVYQPRMKTTEAGVVEDKTLGMKTPRFRLASEIVAEKVTWLWDGRVPNNKLTILAGEPGLGKSMTSIWLAAEETKKGRGVVLVAPEDGAGDTIKPRLVSAGANPELVAIFDSRNPLTLPDELSVLGDAIDAVNASLVILDPLMGMLPSKVDSHKDHDVKRALIPIAAFAEEKKVAIVAVMHFNKGQSTSSINRISGSIAFVGQARAALCVVKDPDDEDKRVLVSIKNNLAKAASSLNFSLEDHLGNVRVKWEGTNNHTEAELLSPLMNTNMSQHAKDVIDILKQHGGDMTVSQINVAMHGEDATDNDYNKTKHMLDRRSKIGDIYKTERGVYSNTFPQAATG